MTERISSEIPSRRNISEFPPQMEGEDFLFDARDVRVWFPIRRGLLKRTVGHVKAVDGVSLAVARGETVGIVGESGCGKTTLGKTLIMLQKPTSGEIRCRLEGDPVDVATLSPQALMPFRRKVQMVFQDPYAALNPTKRIYHAFDEPLKLHGHDDKQAREAIMAEVMQLVNLPEEYLFRYPHELSGGQCQRVNIARALAIEPEVLICDEAVSALDVSVQAQVLNLLKEIQRRRGLTYLFIAHDLSVVQYMSDRVAVMYLGNIVELADSVSLYAGTLHPYTQSLLSAVPVPTLHRQKQRIILKGDVPSPINKPAGCAFHPRCERCMDICKREVPPLLPIAGTAHHVACHLYKNEQGDSMP